MATLAFRIQKGAKLAMTLMALSAFSLSLAEEATQESADALFAAENWGEAEAAYEDLLKIDSTNADNWFHVGQSRHQLGDIEGARDAYRQAIDNGFQPTVRAHFQLARAYASLDEHEQALLSLEEIATTGGVPASAIRNAAEFASLSDEPRFAAVIAALKPCTSEHYRDFDFWLGNWKVTSAGSPQTTASNDISPAQDGCVVLERYQAGGFTGMSINFYESRRGVWHQTWMSNQGGAVFLEGGLNEQGAMVMTDRDLSSSVGSGFINKVTWTLREDGSVRQYWQTSTDEGNTWSVAFDGIYRRNDATEE